MRLAQKITCCLLLIISISLTGKAQETVLTPAFKQATIESLAQRMNDHYVLPEVARKTSDHLAARLKAGHFDEFDDMEAFAKALTDEARSISKDKHILVRKTRPREEKDEPMVQLLKDHVYRMAYQRKDNGGFREAKMLEGNVGYVDLRSFAPLPVGRPFADSFMKLLASSDAMIIDLRLNGGGDPSMVQYLCSYFFEERTHLNSLYFREGDRTNEYWTLDTIDGQRLPNIPLFVLTGERTFSGAEEFSYNMQTQKRATLVGQTTRGGANPGTIMPMNEKLEVFIPTGMAINPITKTNWEGVGVIPEVKTTPEECFETAYDLAKAAGIAHRAQEDKKTEELFANLIKSVEASEAQSGEDMVFQSLKACTNAGLLQEWQINFMGYEYLNTLNNPKKAEIILRANSILFPGSANAYDSYGEALAANGKMKASLKNYKKAVKLARAGNAPDLPMYEDNLKKAEKKME